MKLADVLLPTPQNDHRPHALQRAAIAGMACLVVLSFLAANAQALLWQSSSWLVGTVLPAVVVDLTNDARHDLAEPTLKRSALLDQAATLKAQHMADHVYFAHYSPTGESPWYWFDKVGYQFVHAGENLAIHFTDSTAVVDAWLQSPAHRANIVNENYTEIGVGTAKGMYEGYETVYVVQLFGTPAATLQPAPPARPVAAVVTVPATSRVSSPITITASNTPDTIVAAAVPDRLTTNDTSVPVEAAKANNPEMTVTTKTNQTALLTQTPEAVPNLPEEAVLAESDSPVSSPESLPEPVLVSESVQPSQPSRSPQPSLPELKGSNGEGDYVSSYVATTSDLVAAQIETSNATGGTTEMQASLFATFATSPNYLLQTVYVIVGFFVAVLLLSSVLIGFRHHRPLQVAYGIGLLLLMTGLFSIQAELSTKVVIAATPMELTP